MVDWLGRTAKVRLNTELPRMITGAMVGVPGAGTTGATYGVNRGASAVRDVTSRTWRLLRSIRWMLPGPAISKPEVRSPIWSANANPAVTSLVAPPIWAMRVSEALYTLEPMTN